MYKTKTGEDKIQVTINLISFTLLSNAPNTANNYSSSTEYKKVVIEDKEYDDQDIPF
jgi:hypothetical protein